MAEGQQDHCLIPVWPAIAFASFDQLFDLAFGEVFPCSDLGVFGSTRRDFPYLVVGDTTRKAGFVMVCRPSFCSSLRNMLQIRKVCKVMAQAFFGQKEPRPATTGRGAIPGSVHKINIAVQGGGDYAVLMTEEQRNLIRHLWWLCG